MRPLVIEKCVWFKFFAICCNVGFTGHCFLTAFRRVLIQRQCAFIVTPSFEVAYTCLFVCRYHDSFVYVGLSNGVLTIFDASNPGRLK